MQTQAEVLQHHKSGESLMDETVSVQMSECQYASVSASSLRSQVRNSWNLDTTSVCRVETYHPHVCVCVWRVCITACTHQRDPLTSDGFPIPSPQSTLTSARPLQVSVGLKSYLLWASDTVISWSVFGFCWEWEHALGSCRVSNQKEVAVNNCPQWITYSVTTGHEIKDFPVSSEA